MATRLSAGSAARSRIVEGVMAEVVAGGKPGVPATGNMLLAGLTTAVVPAAVAGLGLGAVRWNRRLEAGCEEASPWPPSGRYHAGILRLPKSRGELEMSAHAIASALLPEAPIWICGANDEGIKSAAAHIAPVLGEAETVCVKSHCRVLSIERRAKSPTIKATLGDWRLTFPIDFGEVDRTWVSYPGLFAHGRIDDGTQLLISHLPPLKPKSRVLDFGCGTGLVAAAARATSTDLDLTLLDSDSVALEAAKENVSGAELVLGRDADVLSRRYDAILSNPPLHDGRADDLQTFTRLMQACPRLFMPGAMLQVVVQGRIGADRLMQQWFANVVEVARTNRFVVLRAHDPKAFVPRMTN